MAQANELVLNNYLNAYNAHAKTSQKLKNMRQELHTHHKLHKKTEQDVKALQMVGQSIGEVLQQLNEHKFIVKTSQGPKYIVGIKKEVSNAIKDGFDIVGARVTLDVTTLTIMKVLPRKVDPAVFKMSKEDPGNIDWSEIGGLKQKIMELKEVVETPLKNPELYARVGIKPPKGVLLYGPPGTGKTLMARALASSLDVTFLKIVSSAVIEKYIGESARLIREMFQYAREQQPCIIFMDEIDAIGGKRSSDSSSSDREVQRTLMELLAQMDGFNELDKVKIIMATNRMDILDPALLRPGRLDRKLEIPLPNEKGRREILSIYSKKMKGELTDELMGLLVSLSSGFNGADLRNVCTEAGMNAVRRERDYVIDDDFVQAVRKVSDSKKLESKFDYKKR